MQFCLHHEESGLKHANRSPNICYITGMEFPGLFAEAIWPVATKFC